MRYRRLIAPILLTLLLIATGGTLPAQIPAYKHVVAVVLENHSYSQIIGNPQAPNINAVAASGATIVTASNDLSGVSSGSHGVRHPSQPNYLELYSGNNQGVIQDGRPGTTDEPFSQPPPFNTPNLGALLRRAGRTFATYSESLPYKGYDGDSHTTVTGQNQYERKHNPAANWVNDINPTPYQLPSTVNLPFSAFRQFNKQTTKYASLPTVSLIVPNEQHDMHDGTIQQADSWLKINVFDTYLAWAETHNSLLIITFDEDGDNTPNNLIPTIFAGAAVKPGKYIEAFLNAANPYLASPTDPGVQTPTGTAMNHYNVLSTIEDIYRLPHIAGSINRPAVVDVFAPTQPQLPALP